MLFFRAGRSTFAAVSIVAERHRTLTDRRFGRRLLLCVEEARPLVQAAFVLRFALGALCTLGSGRPPGLTVLAGAVAWWAATTCVYLYNGLMDLPEDRANGSSRPLASGRLDAPTARAAVVALAVAAVALSVLTPRTTVCVAVFLVLGYLYSAPRGAAKLRAWSASCVTTVATFVTYLGGALATGSTPSVAALLFGAVMSLWVGLIGAVAKDLGSTGGDALAGRRTLAVVRGEAATRTFCALAALCLAQLSLAGAPWTTTPVPLTTGALALAVGATLLTARCLAPRAVAPRSPYRVAMATQYGVHLATGAALLLGM
ncbi:UbiA family prenyltransferase [Streptomyces thermocoprophilus]